MRGMCEAEKKSSMVFQVPTQGYQLLSLGWFAPDQCAAIYVPIHIADTDIFPAYSNGEAAETALAILNKYGHGNITHACVPVESVFFYENSIIEKLIYGLTEDDIKAVLTTSDLEMQQQAVLMQNLYLSIVGNDLQLAASVWNTSYLVTLRNIADVLPTANSLKTKQMLSAVAASIARGRADIAFIVAHDDDAREMYQKGTRDLAKGDYVDAVDIFCDAYSAAQDALFGSQDTSWISGKEKQKDSMAVVFGVAIALLLFWYIIRRS
jgi:hypothetical protein